MRHSARLTHAAVMAALASLGVPAPTNALAQSSQLSTPEIARRATPATVTILAIGLDGDTIGLGSGFIVRPSGVIITNWHVLQGADAAVVVLSTGETFRRVEFLDGDQENDLAIIQIPGFDLPALTPSGTLPQVGERVVAIGSPLGLARTVTEGIVSARRVMDGRELLQMSAPISPGSSGGPVIDPLGRVIAVSTSYFSEGQQLNFAVPVRYAIGLLNVPRQPRALAPVFGSSSPTGRATGTTGDPPHAVHIRVADVDDVARALVNGEEVADITCSDNTCTNDTGWIEVTRKLRPGRNTVSFYLDNGRYGGWKYRLLLSAGPHTYDSGIVGREACPCNAPVLRLEMDIFVTDGGDIESISQPAITYFDGAA